MNGQKPSLRGKALLFRGGFSSFFQNTLILLKSYATFFFQKQFHDDIVGNHTQRQSKRNQKLRRRKWCCTEHGTAKINNAKLYTNDHGHDDDKCTILL